MPPAARVVAVEQTEHRLRPLLARLPVTRIGDLTPLDRLKLPVFTAFTPLARDLTTHMGKGADAESARVSACMEAVERISAETACDERAVRGSFAALAKRKGCPPVDPRLFTLPSDSGFGPEREYTWIESHELLSGQAVLLPADLVLNPPGEGILREVDTNGLASGNTHLEAVVHALCEVIERDVQSQLEFSALFGDAHDARPPIRTILPSSLPAVARDWTERLHAQGLDVIVHDVGNELGVATCLALISDYRYPTPAGPVTQHFAGWGTAPDAELAVMRAFSEAIQSRLGTIQAARDSFNTTPLGARAAARSHRRRLLQRGAGVALAELPTLRCDELLDDLHFLTRRLAESGFGRIYVSDLTRADLEMPVVRVRVPGLAMFNVNRRRVGWRCLRHLL